MPKPVNFLLSTIFKLFVVDYKMKWWLIFSSMFTDQTGFYAWTNKWDMLCWHEGEQRCFWKSEEKPKSTLWWRTVLLQGNVLYAYAWTSIYLNVAFIEKSSPFVPFIWIMTLCLLLSVYSQSMTWRTKVSFCTWFASFQRALLLLT